MATAEVELRNYKLKKENDKRNGLRPLVLRITVGDKVSRKNTGSISVRLNGIRQRAG